MREVLISGHPGWGVEHAEDRAVERTIRREIGDDEVNMIDQTSAMDLHMTSLAHMWDGPQPRAAGFEWRPDQVR